MAKAREMRKQTDPGDVPANVRRTQEASAKSKRRDMTGFAQMPFSEQMKYLSTKGKEGTGFKTKEGSTRKKDEMGDYTPFKRAAQFHRHPSVAMVLQFVARLVEGWCNHGCSVNWCRNSCRRCRSPWSS
jgi:hypothetical protein